MSPRKPYPRWERCPSGQSGSLVYRVDGGARGIVARIDREMHGRLRVFNLKVGGTWVGQYGALRTAKAFGEGMVARSRAR